jgi:predicted nucleic acid-binding protein
MNAEVFVDTNILFYSIDEDPASVSKRQRAEELLLSERWGWSVQVAAEFFVNALASDAFYNAAFANESPLNPSWFL